MKRQTKIIIGWIALTGIIVFVLSAVFSVLFIRGLMGNQKIPPFLLWLGGQQTQNTQSSTTLPDQTTESQPTRAPSAAPTAKPTQKPTMSETSSPTVDHTETPTPVPTQKPKPSISPEPTKAPNIMDPLAPYKVVESIYEEAASAIVGIRVQVPASGTQTARTNEGSGLVIDEQGIVVTQADLFEIALNRQGALLPDVQIDILVQGTERVFVGQLIGRDQTTRCAVIRIKDVTTPFETLPMSEAETLKTGQMVLSIGFPDLLESSGGLSTGFITALDYQMILEDGTPIAMIEADLLMNQRSSGGPLLNLNGEVIALSHCGINGDQFSTNIHAMSIDAVMRIADRLMNQTPSQQTWLGIAVLEPERFLALQKLYDYPDGLYIASVVPDSPAYIANLRRGDVIVSINDAAVSPAAPLSRYLNELPVGTALKMDIYRQSDDTLLSVRAYLQTYGP